MSGAAPDPDPVTDTAASAAGEEVWEDLAHTPPTRRGSRLAPIVPVEFEAVLLDRDALEARVDRAPRRATTSRDPLPSSEVVLAVPHPDGGTQRFAVADAPVMEAGLAEQHPDIRTFAGRGLDDPAATIRASVTSLGFHASVRSPDGIWYVDPFHVGEDDVHISYFTGHLSENPQGLFFEQPDPDHDHDEVAEALASIGDLEAELSSDGTTLLRTYRLALLSDPSYANFFGPDNVTAAKVTLLNRVNQIYEDESAIRMILVADNDRINLNTAAEMTGANGPCGAAPCYLPQQANGCGGGTLGRTRIVIGQLIGASNFDVGHIVFGLSGGGVASLNSVGGNAKAQGCTGLPVPAGDFFGVDYVAHEIGHQFGANHTFNGNQINCSGGNRSAANSVEPGSGSSIMAYAGICRQDNLQPHTDPYWSQRSFQEITNFVTSNRPAINAVQTASLWDLDTEGDSFRIAFDGGVSEPIELGTNYSAAGIKAAIEAIDGWPDGGVVNVGPFGGSGGFNTNGFQVTFVGALAQTPVPLLELVDLDGLDGYVGETAKGGPVDNQGWVITDTGNRPPVVDEVDDHTIPYRTPFAMTGNAVDPDGDTVTYLWEQNDRGLTAIALVNPNKTSGPLFRQFGTALDMTRYDPGEYFNPGTNTVDTDPTRVFPDLEQILAGNTNARTGDCPGAPAPPSPPSGGSNVPPDMIDCYSEFLPTSVYPGPINLRVTVRDGNPGAGGVSSQDAVLSLAPGTGPFLVTSQEDPEVLEGDAPFEVTWDVAGTDVPPIGTDDVRITLSTDGGASFEHVLADATPNDGSAEVVAPNVATTDARLMVEAVGNVFFDVSLAPATIQAAPVVTDDAPAGGVEVQYSDPLDPTVTITATDEDSPGSALTAVATGLPDGLTLTVASTVEGPPGARTWTLEGTVDDVPGTYPVTVTVTDDQGISRSTSFDVVVLPEDARVTYTGAEHATSRTPATTTTEVVLSATVRDISVTSAADGDDTPGDVRNATVTFVQRGAGGGPIPGCTDLPVGLLDADDDTVGTAACSWVRALGSQAQRMPTVGVVVGGSYTRDAAADDTVLSLRPASSSASVTGGGQLLLSDPAGLRAGDVGSRSPFALNAQYVQRGERLQSTVNLLTRRTEAGVARTYQLRGDVTSLAEHGASSATLGATVELVDVTDAANPVVVDDDALGLFELTTVGPPRRDATLVMSVWDRDGGLWLSTSFDGVQPVEAELDSGTLRLR